MFNTLDTARIPMPPGMFPASMHTWTWVEMALNLPYFLVEYQIDEGDGPIRTNIILSQIHDLNSVCGISDAEMTINIVSILCPDYISGKDGYQLEQCAEVWANLARPDDFLAITINGKEIRHCIYIDEVKRADLSRIYCVRCSNSTGRNA
jgi:hypothetical protein